MDRYPLAANNSHNQDTWAGEGEGERCSRRGRLEMQNHAGSDEAGALTAIPPILLLEELLFLFHLIGALFIA